MKGHVNEKPAKGARRLLPLFEQHLAPLQLHIEATGQASCKRGCSHCCYNLAGSTLTEGVLIADYLTNTWPKERIEQVKKGCNEQLQTIDRLHKENTDFTTAQHGYLSEKHPCVFLNVKNGDCNIYRVRPIACRTYYVQTPPENCSPDRPGEKVGVLDFREVSAGLIHFITQIREVPLASGPMQAMVLMGLSILDMKPATFRRWVTDNQKRVEADYLKYQEPSAAEMVAPEGEV